MTFQLTTEFVGARSGHETVESTLLRIAAAALGARVSIVTEKLTGERAMHRLLPAAASGEPRWLVAERAETWRSEDEAILDDITAMLAGDAALRDVIERGEVERRQLLHHTLHDALTKLPTRTLFMSRLAHAIQRARRYRVFQFAVLLLDLDRFKVVNESLGHQMGDQLLVAVARRLELCVREEDTVARLGGDEFAVLLEMIDGPEDAGRVATRMHEALAEPVNLDGYEVFTSASIGVALGTPSHEEADYLVRSADMAMYRAKTSGRGCYELFDRGMHAEALARLQLETDLRRAVERKEFVVHYQPIIDLVSGAVCGVEALVRWQHPERGLLSPAEFIPAAEETGLIVPIGRHVLMVACMAMAGWHRVHWREVPLALSVNLSVKQLAQSDVVREIASILEESALAPSSLHLEITESVVVDHVAQAAALLDQIKALGVQIHMDDFGTGYSSLSHIHLLPLDAIKIDRSFISRMEGEERHAQLVRTIIALARSADLATVAEGVTSPTELKRLRGLGCRFAQGFLFSRPITAEAVDAILTKDPHW